MEAQDPNEPVVRELTAADAPEMRRLFQEVFNKEMTEAHWTWKYARPLSKMYGVFRAGRLVAHYGGLGNVVSLKGEFTNCVQIVDVMVSPSVRQGVRNRAPFYLAASQFIDRFVGIGQFYLFGYGFPNDRHLTLAARMGFYAPVGRIWELAWDLSAPPPPPSRWLRLTRLDAGNFARYRPKLEALWMQQLRDLRERVVVRKDPAWVEWRYLNNPVQRYELVLVERRVLGSPLGLLVLKVEGDRVQLMDVIAPLRRLPQLVELARALTWERGLRTLYTWCSEPDTQRFGAVTQAKALDITTPANVRTSGPRPEELQDRWWLLPGDTDFL